MDDNIKLINFAWCGWRIIIPETWRPIIFKGGWKEGVVIIADESTPVIQIKWQRLDEFIDFDPYIWLKLKHKKTVGQECKAPKPRDFSVVAMFKNVASRSGEQRDVWYGYSIDANLVIEMAINPIIKEENYKYILDTLITSLKIVYHEGLSFWAIYQTSFVVPARFNLLNWRFFSGDISLLFIDIRKRVLMLRQVYPSGIAFKRGDYRYWLLDMPFSQARRCCKEEMYDTIQIGCMKGVYIKAMRRYAWPFGWILPHRISGVCVEDMALRRLLIASLSGIEDDDYNMLKQCVVFMNQPFESCINRR